MEDGLQSGLFPQKVWREAQILLFRLLSVLSVESRPDLVTEFPWLATMGLLHLQAPPGELVSRVQSTLRRLSRDSWDECPLTLPWGGVFFGEGATSALDRLIWDAESFASLFNVLQRRAEHANLEACKGASDGLYSVTEISRLFESMLDADPLITSTPMSRLRRGRMEVVVPQAEGAVYQRQARSETKKRRRIAAAEVVTLEESPPTSETSGVAWVSELPAGCFVLRTSLNRKGAGAYYTPPAFVRFLIEHSLGAAVREHSSIQNPRPAEILQLKVLDPAMGTGAFLLEACRFLGRQLLNTCRECVALSKTCEAVAAERWQQQVTALPELGIQLWQWLQDEHQEKTFDPLRQARVERLCGQLVARHCLYGVDKNPMSAALARLLLWLEAGTAAMPQSLLDHRLITGDSLAGPLLKDLQQLPGDSKEGLSPRLRAGLRSRIDEALSRYRTSCGDHFDSTRVPSELLALQILAAAWSGGVQLGHDRCDNEVWLALAKHIAETGQLPERLDNFPWQLNPSNGAASDRSVWSEQPLHAMLARGLGIDGVPARATELLEELHSGRCVPAVAFELVFPDVFLSAGQDHFDAETRRGFDVVLGNPPWEAIRPQRTEFFGDYDLAAWAGHTRRERREAETRLMKDPSIAATYANYLDHVEGAKRACDRLYERQKIFIDGDLAGRYLDQYRVFLERKAQLASPGGRVSVVVPASFRANAGAVGLRRLYLIENQPEFLYTFHNARQSFEIASGMQFCLLSTRFGGETGGNFETASALDDENWLFAADRDPPPLRYSQALLEMLGGPHLAVANLATPLDRDVTERLVVGTLPLGQHPLFAVLPFQTNPAALNATTDSWRLEATESVCAGDPRDPRLAAESERAGFAPLHEKGTISRFQARERQQPRYVVDLRKCADKSDWLLHRRHFRLMGRSTIHAAEPDKMVFALIPPGGLVSNSALVESAPHRRPVTTALTAMTILNSYVLNYLARQQVVLNLNLFILRNLRVPEHIPAASFLARSALRLSAHDCHYAPLWEEVFGNEWREASVQNTWPALSSDERTPLIAAVNAVVAEAYRVSESDFRWIVEQGASSATLVERELTRECFTELTRDGLDQFIKRHDPYADLTVIESLAARPRPSRRNHAA